MMMTKSITNFDVVLVPFPFTDLSSSKKRPCLVLKTFATVGKIPPLMILAMMTSHKDLYPMEGDYPVSNLSAAGLPKSTIVRLAKVFTAEVGIVSKKLGTLSEQDQNKVKRQWIGLFAERKK